MQPTTDIEQRTIAVSGGVFHLTAYSTGVEVAYQRNAPAGMTTDAVRDRQRTTKTGTPKNDLSTATAPGVSQRQGVFNDLTTAVAVLTRAENHAANTHTFDALSEAGFTIGAIRDHGLRWTRSDRTAGHDDIITTDDKTVTLERRKHGTRIDTILMRLSLGWPNDGFVVTCIWPDFMSSMDTLLLMAVDAANHTEAASA